DESLIRTTFPNLVEIRAEETTAFSIKCRHEQIVMVISGNTVSTDPLLCQFSRYPCKEFETLQTPMHTRRVIVLQGNVNARLFFSAFERRTIQCLTFPLNKTAGPANGPGLRRDLLPRGLARSGRSLDARGRRINSHGDIW